MRRGGVLVVAVMLAAVAVGVALLMTSRGKGTRPETVGLPVVAKADDTRSYLSGAGKPLVSFVQKTAGVDLPKVSAGACRQLLDALPALGSPRALARLASAVPDPQTADMLNSHVYETVDFLGPCAANKQPKRDRFHFSRVVAARRLAALGVVT